MLAYKTVSPYRQMIGSLMDDKFWRILKELVPNLSNYFLEICLEGLKKITSKNEECLEFCPYYPAYQSHLYAANVKIVNFIFSLSGFSVFLTLPL
jgi:hypothetical protein